MMKLFLLTLCFSTLLLSTITHASPTTTPEPDESTTPQSEDETSTPQSLIIDRPGTPEIPHEHPLPAFEVTEVKIEEAKKYPGFSRDCDNTNDCMYRNGIVQSTAHLNCLNKVCVCENNRFIADAPAWRLEWAIDNSCLIAVGGPCGTDDTKDAGNLTIGCQTGLKCIEGRCRDPLKLNQTPLNHSCNENIDCQTGLVCKITAFYFSAQRTCVAPETKGLDGFEEATTTTTIASINSSSSSTPESVTSTSTTTASSSTSTTSAATGDKKEEDNNNKKE